MKKSLSVFVVFVFLCVLCMSALPVSATDIYPDWMETLFDEGGEAINYATGNDLEQFDSSKTTVTVYDETADAYFLRTSKDDPTNFLISKEPTDIIGRMFLAQKPQDPELDTSFAWEFMVRLPEMPETMTFGSGYYASGGFSFCADATNGYFLVQSATSDADAQNLYLQFPMEANKWYHCILVYDDLEQQFYAFVNGEKAKTSDGAEFVSVNPFRLSYLWHWGLQVGGSNIEYKRVDLSQDIAICNVYSQVIPEEDALEIYGYVAEQWGLNGDKPETESTPEIEADASVQPSEDVVVPTPSAEPDNGGNGSGGIVIIIAIVAAVFVIGGGVVAGILVVKKK